MMATTVATTMRFHATVLLLCREAWMRWSSEKDYKASNLLD
jgi:hypothetical protein